MLYSMLTIDIGMRRKSQFLVMENNVDVSMLFGRKNCFPIGIGLQRSKAMQPSFRRLGKRGHMCMIVQYLLSKC